jgi:hypothetical protein
MKFAKVGDRAGYALGGQGSKCFGHHDAARLRERLQPCRDVDTAAKDVVGFHDSFGDMQADPTPDLFFGRSFGRHPAECLLHFYATIYSRDRIIERGKKAVTELLDYMSAKIFDGRIKNRRADVHPLFMGFFFVCLHQSGIARNVEHHHSRTLTLRAGHGHHMPHASIMAFILRLSIAGPSEAGNLADTSRLRPHLIHSMLC